MPRSRSIVLRLLWVIRFVWLVSRFLHMMFNLLCIPWRLWWYSLVMLLHIAGLGAIRFRTGGLCRGPLGPINEQNSVFWTLIRFWLWNIKMTSWGSNKDFMYIDILGTREFGHKGIWRQWYLETMIFYSWNIFILELFLLLTWMPS